MISVLRALKYRNYRLFFFGHGISVVGTWIQTVTTSWLIYKLTQSAFILGIASFCGQIMTFLFVPFAGVFLDRVDRRKVLIVTQTLAMIQASVLTILTITGYVRPVHIILLNGVLGLINAFDMPGRQSFLSDIIEKKEDLPNAIALNSSVFNSGRMIGPSIAGIVIHIAGEGVCFLINAISYSAVLIALLLMHVKKQKTISKERNIFSELKEGIIYILGSPPINNPLMLLFMSSMMGMPVMVLMPVICKEIFNGESHTLGFLMSSSGIGALAGAYILASKTDISGLKKLIAIAAFIFGTGLILFSLSQVFVLSLFLGAITGFGLILQMGSTNTFLQAIVDVDKRGRLMSFYTMAFMGSAPIGSLLAGWLANLIGAQKAILICGIITVMSALIFAMRLPVLGRMVQPIYEKMGIK